MRTNSLSSSELHRLDYPRDGLWNISRTAAYAAAEALMADEDENGRVLPGPPIACERAVLSFGHSVGRTGTDLRRGLNVLFILVELLPIFLIGTMSRMSRLPLEKRIHYFEALEASSIGLLSMLFIAVKVPLCMPAFEEGEELALTGFDRPSTVSRRSLPMISTELSNPTPVLPPGPADSTESSAP